MLNGRHIGARRPFRRPINTVFQSYALFAHMTVSENISFGLTMLGRPKWEIKDRVAAMLALVRMEALAGRRASEISGGQQQRVALGVVGTVVNTDVYKGDINAWAIIFDTPSELKGKVNVVPEMTDVIDAAVLYNGGKKCTGDLTILKQVRDTLIKAKPNWVAMEYGTIQKMGSRDFAASSDWNGSALRQRLANPKIHFGYPKEGFVNWSDNLAVLEDAKNLKNAKLFQNFLMDPKNAGMNSGFHRYANGIDDSDAYMPADMKGGT